MKELCRGIVMQLIKRQWPKEDLQAISRIPGDAQECTSTDDLLTDAIFQGANLLLKTDADRNMLRLLYHHELHSIKLNPETERRVMNAIDESICDYGGRLGAKILRSRFVHMRMLLWEDQPNGPELHEKLGQAFARYLRISRGKAKAPITPRTEKARGDLIAEVKMLRNLLRSRFPAALPDGKTILASAFELITAPDHQFCVLRTNLTAIRYFNAAEAEAGKEPIPRLTGLLTDTVSPSVYVNALLAWSMNRDEEALRQAFTKKTLPKL